MIYRPVRGEDAPQLAAIYAPYVRDTAVTFQVEAPDAPFFHDKMRALAPQYPFIVCEEGGRVAGYAYASALRPMRAYQWAVETTVYLRPDARGAGIGSALYRRLLALLRAQGFAAAYACVTVPNPASDAMHLRLGFEEVGRFPRAGYKLGTWHDVAWYRLPLNISDGAPDAPTPFGCLPEETVRSILL